MIIRKHGNKELRLNSAQHTQLTSPVESAQSSQLKLSTQVFVVTDRLEVEPLGDRNDGPELGATEILLPNPVCLVQIKGMVSPGYPDPRPLQPIGLYGHDVIGGGVEVGPTGGAACGEVAYR